jgi:uncharacterized membrane protein
VLAAAGVLLALMLMVNLSLLLLARAAQREHEFAVSRALGANDAAITRGTLLEGGLLGLAGGSLGTLAAIWGSRTLVELAPLDLPRRDSIVLDWGIAAAVVGVGVLLGLLAAAVPALWAARASLSSLLGEQRRAWRRRSRTATSRNDCGASSGVACSAQQRRARGAQLRAAPPSGPWLQAGGRLYCSRQNASRVLPIAVRRPHVPKPYPHCACFPSWSDPRRRRHGAAAHRDDHILPGNDQDSGCSRKHRRRRARHGSSRRHRGARRLL